jgi:hypothetical protein
MDDTLKTIIKKHAIKNNISLEEANKIYRGYQVKINEIIDALESTDIVEVRIPWLMRFTFNSKKYEKYKEQAIKKSAKRPEAERKDRHFVLGDDTL